MTVLNRVTEIIATRFDIAPEGIERNSTFDDLGLDSLSQIELATALQKSLGIDISDDDLAEMESVADIVDALEAKGLTVS